MQSHNDYVVVIPARYNSTRLPGKPLIKIAGKEMLLRTYHRCTKVVACEKIYVATDSKKIKDFCSEKSINVVMTGEKCITGTDRIAEFSEIVDSPVYINVQGDEPILNPNDLKTLIERSINNPEIIFNGYCNIDSSTLYESENIPKVVFSENENLLYMSRSPIPYSKQYKPNLSFRQVCIYAFPKKALKNFSSRKNKTFFESNEDIEILRFLELGYEIKMIKMSSESIAVDIPNDIIRVEDAIRFAEKNEKS
tara:strand:- start:390 stop:1145 length:756 start_codon:yes stop_codon:yes gene_type:complete